MLAAKQVAKLSITAAIVTLLLKFIAWHLTGSVGLFSDAMESLVNLSAAVIALTVLSIAEQPADDGHPYGHDKAEYFSSGVEGALIIVAAMSIIWSAWQRFFDGGVLRHLPLGVAISVLASLINFAVASYMAKAAKAHDSITLEADSAHLMTDVWTSVGLVAGLSVLIIAPPSWQLLDPVIAIAIAMHIIHAGWQLLGRSLNGLMDATLPAEEMADIRAAIQATTGSQYPVAGLRARKAGSRRFVEFKLLVPGDMRVAEAHLLCDQLEAEIARRLTRTVAVIHVEPVDEPNQG